MESLSKMSSNNLQISFKRRMKMLQDMFSCKVKLSSFKRKLKKDGFLVFKEAYPLDFCNSIIQFIDQYQKTDNIEKNYSDTELRIWSAENEDPLLSNFFNESNSIISAILAKNIIGDKLLAIRNKSLETSDTLSKVRRWHIDSLSTQYKIFLFLTDTTELSGPFEFIPNTHRKLFKLKMLLKGHYIKFSQLKSSARLYQHLNESLIEQIITSGYSPKPMLCKAGTLMVVDTSAIHRARPCLQDHRYALTMYF